MKPDFKLLCSGVFCVLVYVGGYNFSALAQEMKLSPDTEEESYVPREPTKEERRRYEINSTIEEQWAGIFAEPQNGELHWNIAKQYNLLGNSDIAEHELARAQELGIERYLLLADLGRAYLNREKYQQIFSDILIDEAPTSDHGEILLIYGHAYFAGNNFEQAFINYYKTSQLIEDRFELNSQLAILYDLMGDYDKAELNATKALDFESTNVELLMLKGMLVHRRVGVEQSYSYFEKAAFYRPENIETQLKLAGALYDLRRKEEAMAVLKKILAGDDSHAYANFMIATLFAEGNNLRTATGYLNRAGSGYDDFVPGLLLKGKLAYATRSYEQAEKALARLIRLDPDHMDARRLLGASMIHLRKFAQAERVLQYIADNNMLAGNDLLLLGNAYILSGDYDRGTQFLDRAAKEDLDLLSDQQKKTINQFEIGNNFGVSLNLTGIINQSASSNHQLILKAYDALKEGKHEIAFENAVIIIEQDRRNPIGYNLLGLSYLAQGKNDEAGSNFRRAIEIDRSYHQARINLARLELGKGNQNAAINQINGILSVDETYIPAYELLFDMAKEANDPVRAERYLFTATSANPELLSIRQRLFNYYIEQNNLTKARRLSMQMVQNFPDHAISYKAVGKVSLLQGDVISARDYLQQALTLNNSDRDVYIMLSQALISNQEGEKARPLLKSGLQYVKDILPLQIELINLARLDGNYVNSHHYVAQLKLDEKTKARAYIYEGELYLQQQRSEDAILSFENARKAGANMINVNTGLVEANALISQVEQISRSASSDETDISSFQQDISHYENLLNQNQSDIVALHNLARIYISINDISRAARYATLAYNIDNLNAGIADTYAVTLMMQGNHAQARRILEFAASMEPNNLDMRFHYAQALNNSGATARAILELEVIVNSGTQFENEENARDLLATLRSG